MAHSVVARPQAVVTAVNLLWLALLIGFMLATSPSSIPLSSKYQLDVFSRLMIQVLFAAIFFMIWRRRKWARTALFIVVLFGTPVAVWLYLETFPSHPLRSSFGLIRLGLMLAALVILCQKTASDWFNQRRSIP